VCYRKPPKPKWKAPIEIVNAEARTREESTVNETGRVKPANLIYAVTKRRRFTWYGDGVNLSSALAGKSQYICTLIIERCAGLECGVGVKTNS